MEAVDAHLERWMEAMAESVKITKRERKESTEETEVNTTTSKASDEATNYASSAGTSSDANYASTVASMATRAPTSNSTVVGVARRSAYILIIIMPKVLIQELDILGLAPNGRPGWKY